MRRRTLIALSIAAGFALPLTVQAAGEDKAKSSGSTATPSASQGASGDAKMFEQLDKNKDGSISKEEAKGTPHEKDFTTLDKNNDGKLSRQELTAASEHGKDKAATGGTSGSPSGASTSGSSTGGAAPSQPKSSKY